MILDTTARGDIINDYITLSPLTPFLTSHVEAPSDPVSSQLIWTPTPPGFIVKDEWWKRILMMMMVIRTHEMNIIRYDDNENDDDSDDDGSYNDGVDDGIRHFSV